MNNKNLKKPGKKNLNETNNNEDNYINYFYTFITVTGVLLFFTLAKTFYTFCGILYLTRSFYRYSIVF